jgi:beta-glucosidase
MTSLKVEELLTKMTLKEKLGQLNLLTAGEVKTGAVVNENVEEKLRQGLVGGIFGMKNLDNIRRTQKLAVENSRLGIPLLFAEDIIHGFKSPIFPLPLAMASSWDPALVEKTARIAAIQASAEGIVQTYSPMVDISRDPRWGRVAEGFGEDPHLTSAFARAMVRGYQGTDLAAIDTILACVKHFAGYGAGEGGRDYAGADMSPAEFHDTILPPFEAAFKEGAASVMASFNTVNGHPSHANRELLTELLRLKYAFVGFVVGDYTGVQELSAHGLGDYPEVAARAMEAGLDMDMVDELFIQFLEENLGKGRITQLQIDTACRRILEAKDNLGLLDDPYLYMNDDRLQAVLNREPEFRAYAREVASRSCVLLNNQNNVLPLKKSGTIAVIGPLAHSRRNMPGTWAVAGEWRKCSTVLEGLREVGGDNVNVLYAKGANITENRQFAKHLNVHDGNDPEKCVITDPRPPEEMLAEAVTVARQADSIILVVGEGKEATGESSSMTDIALPQNQIKLIRAVIATGKPVALIVMSGRPMALENILMDEDTLALGDSNVGIDDNKEIIPDTILWAPFGGTESGGGVADVLFGDYNPSGKLPMTFPRHVGQIPIHYAQRMTGRPLSSYALEKGWAMEKFKTGYIDRKSTPLFEFGHGLSYTTFGYGPVTFDKDRMMGAQTLTAYTTVTNTGKRAGEEVVQLYITDPICSRTRPVRQLKNFQKVMLQPGESRELAFKITNEDLKFSIAQTIADTRRKWEAGDFIIQIGPSSSRGNSATIFWDKPKIRKKICPELS